MTPTWAGQGKGTPATALQVAAVSSSSVAHCKTLHRAWLVTRDNFCLNCMSLL